MNSVRVCVWFTKFCFGSVNSVLYLFILCVIVIVYTLRTVNLVCWSVNLVTWL